MREILLVVISVMAFVVGFLLPSVKAYIQSKTDLNREIARESISRQRRNEFK